MKIIKSSNLTWIDVLDPKQEDIDYLRKNFNFHPIILEELLVPTLRPKVENYDHYLFMVLHFPIYNPRLKATKGQEIDFLITKDAVITIRYKKIKPFKSFITRVEKEKEMQQSLLSKTPGHLLYFIIKELYEFSLRQLNHVEKRINETENKIFKGREKEMLKELALLKRDILGFRRTIKPQGITLESLANRGKELFGRELKPYFSDIIGEYTRTWNRIEDYKETLESLDKTNESLLSTKTNEIMKVLTIFAVITFPLTLLASIFGMNTKILPLMGLKNDFWIIMGIMGIATISMFIYFKKKRWI